MTTHRSPPFLFLSLAWLAGCSTSKATPGPSCTSLESCCANLPASDVVSCAQVVASGDETSCSTLLAGYGATNSCSTVLVTFDGGPHPDATVSSGGGCSGLSACCSKLPASMQAGCQAEVSNGTASTCTTALEAYQLSGSCGGIVPSQDAGADASVSLSGPSCPPGMPPVTFVSSDAGADCLKCQANCLSTEGWGAECDRYYACYCPCAAGDTGCQQACAPLEGDCMQTTIDLQSCLTTDCSTLCPQPPHTGCIGDAGTPNPGETASCQSCALTSCMSQQSAFMMDCPGASACVSKCQCSDLTCIEACIVASSTCESAVSSFDQCLSSSCDQGCAGILTGLGFGL